jgi:hypothetical protein
MNKTEYRKYISSADWQERRKLFLAGKDGLGSWCNRCRIPRWLASIAYDQDLHVHHKSYANIGIEKPEDLEILCKRCHEIETFSRSDLRALKVAICSVCGMEHYDVYASICEECFKLTTGRVGINLLSVNPSTSQLVWETVVRNFIKSSLYVGPSVGEIVSVFSEALTEGNKKLHEQAFENIQSFNKQRFD